MSSGVRSFIRFCVTGFAVTAFDFVLIGLFVQVMPRLAAIGIAYLPAVALHFCLNRAWVFAAGDKPAAGQLPRYLLAVAACWLCTVGVAAFALAAVTPNAFLAKVLALPCATVLGFVLMRRFVFRRPGSAGEE